MPKKHHYKTHLNWIGNTGNGTKDYRSYERNHENKAGDKTVIPSSSDPSFRGDPTRYNPEELFLASLSSCHMLWFLHLCSINGVNVVNYEDLAEGTMEESTDGSGRFTEVVLKPIVTVSEFSMIEKSKNLHKLASKKCFIANSVNFPVSHEVETITDQS